AVFSDVTLKDLCRYLPVTEDSMLTIRGIGTQKFARYGAVFIKELVQYRADNPDYEPKIMIQQTSKKKVATTKEYDYDGPSHLETYRLYQNGKTLKAIADMRDLQMQTVEGHLFKAYVDGYPILWETIFSQEEEVSVLEQFEKVEERSLKQIKELLPDTYTYFTIKAVLVKNDLWT